MSLKRYANLINSQLQSGLSAMAFCQQHSLNYANFLYWKKKHLTHQNPPQQQNTANAFAQLIINSPTEFSSALSHATIHFAHASLSIPLAASQNQWQNIIHAVASLTAAC